MRYFLIALVGTALCLGAVGSARGQAAVEGTVTDAVGEPVPFANVLLLSREDSTLVRGAPADENGQYAIPRVPAGDYLLQGLMVGYATLVEPISVPTSGKVERSFTLEEASVQLEGVVVTAQRPLFEKQADRMVVNVQSSAINEGRSALEVLENSPGVQVDRQNDAIQMMGKGEVRVMINGKLTRMPMTALVAMLDGMPSANIQKIEVITSPPARYEASGDAGIINIVMIKDESLGTNGNYSLTGGVHRGPRFGGSFGINTNTEKVSFFANLSSTYRTNPFNITQTSEFTENGQTTFLTSSLLADDIQKFSINLNSGAEWRMTDKTNVALTFDANLFNSDETYIGDNISREGDGTTTITDVLNSDVGAVNSTSTSLGLTHMFTSDRTLSVDLSYLTFGTERVASYGNDETLTLGDATTNTQSVVEVLTDSPLNIYVGSVDYADRLGEKVSIETGVKMVQSVFNNEVNVEETLNGVTTTLDRYSLLADMNEQVFGAYVQAGIPLGQKVDVKAGLRFENTDLRVRDFLTATDFVDTTFGTFFPSLSVSWRFKKGWALSSAYNRRISRPSFDNLSPSVNFVGPNATRIGNPRLLPAVSENVDLSLSYKGAFISTQYSYTNSSIVQYLPFFNTEFNELQVVPANLQFERNLFSMLNVPIPVAEWYTIRLVLMHWYNLQRAGEDFGNQTGEGMGYRGQMFNNFTLPANFNLELGIVHDGPDGGGLWFREAYTYFTAGVRKDLPGNWGQLSFSGSDIFRMFEFNLETFYPNDAGFNQIQLDWAQERYLFTYRNTFGSKEVRRVRIRSGAQEERDRIGSGG